MMESNMTTEQKAEQYASKEMNSFLTFAPLTSNEIYDIIKQAYLAGAKDKWLPYPENKPEKDGEYLVSVEYYTCTEVEVASWFEDFEGWSFANGKTCGRQTVSYKVTAFKFKPEPYTPPQD